jgi:Icc-related predicted phosphoesterase
MDITADGEKVGCEELMKAVLRIQPKVHIFGHIHEGYGELKMSGTHFVNASICTLSYRPKNSPIVVDLPIGPKVFDLTQDP